MNRITRSLFALSALAFSFNASASQHGDLTILTTPDGAGLPASAVIEGFPLLVRLHKDWFDFNQAKPQGEDIRFASSSGVKLPYQIEAWDAAAGTASIWVRIPRIEGNARQTIRMSWGDANAGSESNPNAVFDTSNGYVNVWHMDGMWGTAKDTGTTSAAGVIGPARHFDGEHGIFAGDQLTHLPTGSSAHSSEAWVRAEQVNGCVIAWGNEHGQGKVVMHFKSPPHISMDCYFSGGNVSGDTRLPMSEWLHVMHTYREGESKLYVNGVLDGTNTKGPPLAIKNPAKLWIGGWYNRYDFVGDLDEVRVSNVARSADWVRLQYENQKPQQTLVGPLMQPGNEFSVSQEKISVAEGKSVMIQAKAGGAQKVSWSLLRDGGESVVATDRFAFNFDAGRVTGDSQATLRFKAVYADGVKTIDIAITIQEAIAEPVFSFKAPANWDGRSTIEIVPQVTNIEAMRGTTLDYQWEVGPIAVTKTEAANKLYLKRAENSGALKVTAILSNGGKPSQQTVTIDVKPPARDAWVVREPEKDEKPEDGQFIARDDKNEGTLHCKGTAASKVTLSVYADEKPFKTETSSGGDYAFAVKLKPGLIKYRMELSADGKVVHSAKDIVCGDAFLLNGQSNTVATDWGKEEPPTFHSEWIRTFGHSNGNPKGVHLWGEATYRARDGRLQIGYWAMELAKRLVESQKMPICIINGAVGGTRIDQHQRTPDDFTDMTSIYGRLLWRVREARLTHGIRGVLWHQGENDQGADGPTGGYGWEKYRQLFIELASAWKEDYPNIQHYHIFQIWPKSCAMGINGSDNRLREVQRTLPTAFSNMTIMSTLGIQPPGGCHYPPAGYSEIARLVHPIIQREFYGVKFDKPITPPNLLRAAFASALKDQITLEFDQPVQWDNALISEFYLDGEKGQIASGNVTGNVLTLKLTAPSSAKTISYLDSAKWSQANLLIGANGIAALTFCNVSIAQPR